MTTAASSLKTLQVIAESKITIRKNKAANTEKTSGAGYLFSSDRSSSVAESGSKTLKYSSGGRRCIVLIAAIYCVLLSGLLKLAGQR